MNRILASLVMAGALCAAGGAAEAQQVNRPYRTVGQWKVESIYEKRKFLLCRAGTNTQAGLIGVLQYARKSWALSFPDMNFSKGTKLNGMLEMGRASQPVSVTAGRPGMRENFTLNGNVLEAMRQGGHMSLAIGGKTWSWYMNDAGLAMGAVQDCVVAALKDGGVLDTQAAAPAAKPAYQGCYVDTPSRTLPVTLITKAATLESCNQAAKNGGYTYFGLQYGGQCFAGRNPTYTRTMEGECNMRCQSNTKQVCGGFWRNSVWRVN